MRREGETCKEMERMGKYGVEIMGDECKEKLKGMLMFEMDAFMD